MKKLRYLVFMLLLLGFISILYIKTKDFSGGMQNSFIQNTAYFASPVNSQYKIDLVYLVDRNNIDRFDTDSIEKIEFLNSKTTKINKYEIVAGDTSKKYNIKTLSLEITFSNVGEEMLESIIIFFKDGSRNIYPIGWWTFSIVEDNVGNHLAVGDKYPFITGSTNSFLTSLKNETNQDVLINTIEVDFPGFNFNLPSSKIKGNDEIQISLPLQKEDFKTQYTIIRPRVIYTVEENRYHFYPPAIYYGYLNVTDETLENELNRK